MKLKSRNYYLRKAHRYLGLVLGVQFLFWTLGGLYFSWNDIDEVHGDHLRSEKRYFPASMDLVSPQVVLQNLSVETKVDSVQAIQLVKVASEPVYQVRYFGAAGSHNAGGAAHGAAVSIQLANAETGKLLAPLSKAQAIEVAKLQLAAPTKVEQVEYLTEVGGHHEYREKPLPAWAISFSQPANCTVYVSAELGTFQAIRHNQWRMFDFFWMLHTMDYEGRDNFGNILLKAFSLFGVFTVLSGFGLYAVSSRAFRAKKTKKVGQ